MNLLLQVQNRFRRKDLTNFLSFTAVSRIQDHFFFGQIWIIDLDVEHETVQLRFGQRIGPLLFDRVLCGNHKKGLGKLISCLADRDFSLLHRLQQCGLCFWRGPVDFIGEQNIRKYRAFHKSEFATPGIIFIQHIRASDVRRHQVRRKLDPFEPHIQNLGDRRHCQRFCQTWYSNE